MRRLHTEEELRPIVASSISYAECLRKLGLRPSGGNYKNLQRNIDKFGIKIEHMKHQSWSQGREIKKFGDLTRPTAIKKRIIKEVGHKCQMCSTDEWMGEKIVLELDHIDGNNRNNSRENLRILCPNCHSTTPTWRNRKR